MKIKKTGERSLLTLVTSVSESTGLSIEVVSNLLAQSFRMAFLKEYPDNFVDAIVDPESGKIELWRQLQVVTDEFYSGEGFEDEETLIPISKALQEPKNRRNPSKPKVGDVFMSEVDINSFDSKITNNIQTFFKKLTQNEISKSICQKWNPFQGTVMEGVVEEIIESREDRSVQKIIVSMTAPDGSVAKGIISRGDLVWFDAPGGTRVYENLSLGNSYLFYIKEVSETSVRFPISLSRTDPEIVKHLMKTHISEMAEGLVEIMGIARIAGMRTKVLVRANSSNIDPVGCCIGPKGKRLRVISNILMNERIDIILWSEDPVKNVINSFSAGKIIGYKLDEDEENSITLIATLDNLLSCIGRKGSNTKLVYMLTNWKINLKTIQEAKEENLDYISIDEDKFVSSNKISDRIFKMHLKKRGNDSLDENYPSKGNVRNASRDK